MELVSLLIAAGFVFYGWSFLLRWRRTSVAAGKPWTVGSRARPVAVLSGHPYVKSVLLLVLSAVLLALALGALLLGSGMLLQPACTTGVVITEGPHGEKIECVCVGGVQAACFEPGP